MADSGTSNANPVRTHAPWYGFATPFVGKSVRWASRLLHHGGSAFPGKVVERFDPTFLSRTLSTLPLGVVLVSGTNGKTTTTRMVATMLESLGLKVFTNPTGSNFTRGVVSSILTEVPLNGRLDADIAVLELDEAYAVHFVEQVQPRYALLLNVMRDQLDRFGEIDNTARLLGHVAAATRGTVVLNREDPRIARLRDVVKDGVRTRYFGLAEGLRHYFPADDDMTTTFQVQSADSAQAPEAADAQIVDVAHDVGTAHELHADVMLTKVGDHHAQMVIDGREYESDVKLEGVYNLFNAAAALAVVRAVQADLRKPNAVGYAAAQLGRADSARARAFTARAHTFADADTDALFAALADVTPAFGRGEVIDVNGSPVELLLVKNPMGFRLALASFPPESADTMIAINDQYADGRDMSWLWDVDFTSLRPTGVAMVSGVRAWDMALRLEYDQVPVARVEPDLHAAVREFVNANPGTPKHIYCTYTAMLAIRAELAAVADVADAGVGK